MRNFPLPLVLHHALNPLVRLNMSISWCTLLSIIPPPRCYRGPRSRRVLLLSWNLQEILVTMGPRWCPHATQLSASGHCTDRSAAEAQHWRWPGRGPVTSIPSLRHFSALIRLQVLSPPNIVSLISPLLSSAKCLTFSSRLTSSFTWMQCNFGLKN